jgi:signal transduction histidine kinase
LRTYFKLWTAAVAACLATLVLGALFLPHSYALTALSDIVQFLLLFSGTLSFVPLAVRSRGRLRLFWSLIAAGTGFWCLYQFVWIYFEVWLHTDVPNMCAGDVVLFMHIVPFMAAMALRPHAPEDEYAARLRRLDFVLMIMWWGYLYVLFVLPWQYVVLNDEPYGRNLNTLYSIEKLAFLVTLVVAWIRTRGGWRLLYANLFGACIAYAVSSHFANWAIDRHTYYSGSLYDIPLAASMAWLTVIGLWTQAREPEAGVRPISTTHSVGLARLGMVAAFSLPLFAAWALQETGLPASIRSFRLLVTLAAALLMGAMVFVRQRFLDRELHRLLENSQESFAHLKRLQAQITESEKLASVGQLVGGVAHELNNPITALMGYSDLLLCSALNPEQKNLADKIVQHTRRTRSLVASLLSFAKQGPAAMAAVDLNALLRTAIKLTQPQWQSLKIDVQAELPPQLLLVHGDANQLLQVCVQIVDEALHAAQQKQILTIAGECKDGFAVINVFSAGSEPAPEAGKTPIPAHETPAGGLGFRACEGILRQHRGRISWQQNPTVGIIIRVEIPLITTEQEKSLEAGVPVMWQPQPSA